MSCHVKVSLIFSLNPMRSPSTIKHTHTHTPTKPCMYMQQPYAQCMQKNISAATIATDGTYSDMTSESALQVTPVKPHALEAGKVQSASTLLGSIIVFKVYRAAACCAAREPAPT